MLDSYQVTKVAITGGISCGKSSVCGFFKELGAYVVSADEIVHTLLSPNTSLGQEVIRLIGPKIVVNYQIDRSQIAKKVFNHPKLLRSLERLLHPAVRTEVEKLYQHVNEVKLAPLFIVEIPLLFETGDNSFFDYTVAIIADPSICRQRFQLATGYGKEEYDKRMAQQLPTLEKARRADYIIFNNGNLVEMKNTVNDLFNKLIYKHQLGV